MPLHTPSPRRFLAPAPPAAQKTTPKVKTQSGLRHVASAIQTPRPIVSPDQTLGMVDSSYRTAPSKRFKVTPSATSKPPIIGERRRAQDSTEEDRSLTFSTPKPKFPKLKHTESIDSISPSSSADLEIPDEFTVGASIELPSANEKDDGQMEEDEEEEILFVIEERNKRRRVSPDLPTSPIRARSPSPTPGEHSSPHIPSPVAHRFKVPTPRPPVLDNAPSASLDRQVNPRPQFIIPRAPPSPTKSAAPLPETFSPSRKKAKYVSGGLASTLQSWVHETASAGHAALTNSAVVWGRDKEDGVKLKIRVTDATGGRFSDEEGTESWPGSVVFVRGVTDIGLYNASRASSSVADDGDHTDIKVMLAGQGGARGKGGICIRRGAVLGVRAPMWDVQVGLGDQAETWIVAVEWVIL